MLDTFRTFTGFFFGKIYTRFYLDTDLIERMDIPPIIEKTNDMIKMDENPIAEIINAAITGAMA